jgi:P27 family predicted phage terminase small subunit
VKGRKPEPVEQRRLEWNPARRPLPEPVLVAGRRPLEPPAGLPAEALDVWDAVVPTLDRIGLLDGVDALALEGLCVLAARARAARDLIEREGIVAHTAKGVPVVHPAVRVERDAWRAFLHFAEQYALTPVARTRLGLAELQRRSLADELETAIGANPRR